MKDMAAILETPKPNYDAIRRQELDGLAEYVKSTQMRSVLMAVAKIPAAQDLAAEDDMGAYGEFVKAEIKKQAYTLYAKDNKI